MVSENLIYRAPDPNDRRKVRVFSTPDGQAVYDEMKPLLEGHEESLLAAIADISGQDVPDNLALLLEKLCNRDEPAALRH